jgi:hypothetical protein
VKEVLTTVGRGSGSKGITTILRCLKECPAEVRLEQAHPEVTGRLDANEDIMCGTLVHRKLEAYYSKRPLVEPIQDLAQIKRVEARADLIYAHYIAKHPRHEFGRIIECEVPHSGGVLNKIYPGYSCKYDLVPKPTQAVCNNMQIANAYQLRPDRYYIVDHKVVGWFPPRWETPYENSIQQHTYMAAFKLLWPRRKLGGCIVNCISRGKTPEVRRLLVEPDKYMQRVCHHAWIHGNAAYNRGVCNPTHCFQYRRDGISVCPFLGSHCDRTGVFNG